MDRSRVEPTIFFIEKISFSMKLFSGHFYGQSFVKTVRGPFRHLKSKLKYHNVFCSDTNAARKRRIDVIAKYAPFHKFNSLCSSIDRDRGGWFLTKNQRPLSLIYMTPTNLHNSNPDVGQARFSSMPRCWVDHDLTLHVAVSIQCRANGGPELCALDQS